MKPPEIVTIGNQGTFTVIDCLAEGFPPPKVTWTLNGQEVVPSADFRVASNGSLMLSPVPSQTKRDFTCSVSNGIGLSFSASVSVRVLGKSLIRFHVTLECRKSDLKVSKLWA